jgi:YggT family protein
MDIILIPLLSVVQIALSLYWWAVLLYIIIGWLEQFNIINRYNQFVYSVHTFLFRIVEPALLPLRRILPNLGAVDISPILLILMIHFLQGVLFMITTKFM